jgi:hypothetical protein
VIRRHVLAAIGCSLAFAAASGAVAETRMSDSDTLVTGDDPDHPIPYMSKLDLLAEKKAGGADLIIVIASPLRADERSQRRLLYKIETYLSFIASPEYRDKFGPPDPATTRIVVDIDEDSDPAIFDLLKRCEAWTLENHTALVVERKPMK